MPYSTVEDVRLALVSGAVVDELSAAELQDSQIEDAIVEADAQIDGYLAMRYAVPPTPTPLPPLLRIISRDIAAYLATLTWLVSVSMDPEHHPVALRYKRVLYLLEEVRDGKIVLPLDPPDSNQAKNDPAVENQYDGYMFTKCDFDLVEIWDHGC